MKRFLLLSATALFAFCANANDDNLKGWTAIGVNNVEIDSNRVVSFTNPESGYSWDHTFNPPTWYAPSKGKNETFEISFDAKYEGDGTGGNGIGNITFIQGRQFIGYTGNLAELCESLGIEEVDATWKLQNEVEQLYIEEYTGAAYDFWGGRLTRNVNFYPTSQWKHFTMTGKLGRHAADSVDLTIEFGSIEGTYSIKNFVFSVNGNLFETYFIEGQDIGDLRYKLNNNGTASVVFNNLSNNDTSVIIPEKVTYCGKDYKVTTVNQIAFNGCTNLTSVTIPYSVTYIEKGAFNGCNNIKTLSSNTNAIGQLFQNKTSLKNVIIGDSVTSISYNAFYGCWGLTSITIPKSVNYVGDNAFLYCDGITSITNESDADFSAANLYFTKEMNKYHVLSGKSVEIVSFYPNSGDIIIPQTVSAGTTFTIKSIGERVFSGKSNITSIVLPTTIETIKSDAFYNCSGLTSIIIPDSVVSIGNNAFDYCKNLNYITFGNSVEEIGSEVFTGCDSLQNIICKSQTPPIVKNTKLTDNDLQDVLLYTNASLTYPDGAKMYRKMQPWCNFDSENDNAIVKDTVFVYDTVHYVVNNKDTLFIYDTIQHIISSKDTIYLVDNNSRSLITATSTNTKMGIVYGSGVFVNGSKTEIVAIEKYGYHFTKWSDGNTDNPRFVEVTSDCSFSAEFEVNNYSVLAEANAVAMGKVEGGAEYAYLSRTQLKAIPNEGYEFKEWSDGETANPRNILVYSDTSFTAVFVALETTTVAESAANAINIYTAGKTIVVENATEEIRVYDAMGNLISRNANTRVRSTINVKTSGVYIVKIGGTVKRVVVN